jgi:hypothetical protein
MEKFIRWLKGLSLYFDNILNYVKWQEGLIAKEEA